MDRARKPVELARGAIGLGRVSLELDLSLDTLIAWKRKPHAMVEDLFGVKSDPWQQEALESLPHTPRMAVKACAGPGKTALLAWLGWNFLLTRPHAMVDLTSVNAANLWTEFGRATGGHLDFSKLRKNRPVFVNWLRQL